MKKIILLRVLRLLAVINLLAQDNTLLKLWYNQPAKQWVEALPIGNGHLGAMLKKHFGYFMKGITGEWLVYQWVVTKP
jgi:hypothetical protein